MAGLFKVFMLAALIMAVWSQDYGGFEGDIEGAGDGEGDYGGFDGGESASEGDYAEPSENHETVHKVEKRSVELEARAHRVRRGGHGHGHGYVGPVYTYVKTDHHGNFKWGARHLVGSKYGHGHH